ncbi:hypothetical protein GL2_15760 [Microbulbifer sp. GL-2]|nr:hypothetical protein GL2_15760 [Microbulbifer sp. GL-2]
MVAPIPITALRHYVAIPVTGRGTTIAGCPITTAFTLPAHHTCAYADTIADIAVTGDIAVTAGIEDIAVTIAYAVDIEHVVDIIVEDASHPLL